MQIAGSAPSEMKLGIFRAHPLAVRTGVLLSGLALTAACSSGAGGTEQDNSFDSPPTSSSGNLPNTEPSPSPVEVQPADEPTEAPIASTLAQDVQNHRVGAESTVGLPPHPITQRVQEILKKVNCLGGAADGVIDSPRSSSPTYYAIKDFQTNKGLEADGIAGPATAEELVKSDTAGETTVCTTAHTRGSVGVTITTASVKQYGCKNPDGTITPGPYQNGANCPTSSTATKSGDASKQYGCKNPDGTITPGPYQNGANCPVPADKSKPAADENPAPREDPLDPAMNKYGCYESDGTMRPGPYQAGQLCPDAN